MRNEKEFALEEKGRRWSIPFYQSKGYLVQEVTGKANREKDLILERDGRKINVEEKCIRYGEYNDFVFEIVQDVMTKNWGWIYDVLADVIIFIIWDDRHDLPRIVYKVKWLTCKKFVFDNLKDYPLRKSLKGYGFTIFAVIPWTPLLDKKIAEILYVDPDPEATKLANEVWDNPRYGIKLPPKI
jgi:hypothetical protein